MWLSVLMKWRHGLHFCPVSMWMSVWVQKKSWPLCLEWKRVCPLCLFVPVMEVWPLCPSCIIYWDAHCILSKEEILFSLKQNRTEPLISGDAVWYSVTNQPHICFRIEIIGSMLVLTLSQPWLHVSKTWKYSCSLKHLQITHQQPTAITYIALSFCPLPLSVIRKSHRCNQQLTQHR